MSLKGKLSRLKKDLGISEHIRNDEQLQRGSDELSTIPFIEKWDKLESKPAYYESMYCMIREKNIPIHQNHGRYSFVQLHPVMEKWNELRTNHPLSAACRKQSDLLFFDTETTGLSSGAGNSIFLLGYSQVQEHSVVVKQYFLPGPEHEVAFYHHFLTDVSDFSNLVTYNGKAFDWPQVKTRHTFVRNEVPKLPLFGHFDLLHGARRLWKNTLPSCKLSVVEKEILQFQRIEDTPGYLAPMLYFDFIHEQDPDFIEGVLEHNEWDVLSLITLYIHLSICLQEYDSFSLHPIEKFEIARWYEAVGEQSIALFLYKSVLESETSVQYDAVLPLAKLYKKNQQYQKAVHVLEHAMTTAAFPKYGWCHELAMLYEHQWKDVEKALHYAKQAMELVKKSKTKKSDQELLQLMKRIERLTRKLQQSS
ncbi:ribonuclease H-like domain-containing protein [Alkalihalobacterium bogoriense]|uniref:ribonuclease H-like domain-containing protein n=1 Tax=Alkalihalobacterium bogoriense TaxID=246272 RepID=UPI00047B946C|nr:ribonuclease H-like domain-containing protein [Alkalihalobacterium bogoriense]